MSLTSKVFPFSLFILVKKPKCASNTRRVSAGVTYAVSPLFPPLFHVTYKCKKY